MSFIVGRGPYLGTRPETILAATGALGPLAKTFVFSELFGVEAGASIVPWAVPFATHWG